MYNPPVISTTASYRDRSDNCPTKEHPGVVIMDRISKVRAVIGSFEVGVPFMFTRHGKDNIIWVLPAEFDYMIVKNSVPGDNLFCTFETIKVLHSFLVEALTHKISVEALTHKVLNKTLTHKGIKNENR